MKWTRIWTLISSPLDWCEPPDMVHHHIYPCKYPPPHFMIIYQKMCDQNHNNKFYIKTFILSAIPYFLVDVYICKGNLYNLVIQKLMNLDSKSVQASICFKIYDLIWSVYFKLIQIGPFHKKLSFGPNCMVSKTIELIHMITTRI